jgi:hypothetical protein
MALAISEESNSGTPAIAEQASPAFLVVWATSEKFGLCVGNMKFSTQNIECLSMYVEYAFICLALIHITATNFLKPSGNFTYHQV